MKLEILQFILAKGSGDKAIRKLIQYTTAYGETAGEEICSSVTAITQHLKLTTEVSESITRSRDEASELLNTLSDNDVTIIWEGNGIFPKQLSLILGYDAPPYLFVMGNKDLLKEKSIGFCGSRKASEKGIEITRKCSKKLSSKGFCIVSGYAHGVDMAAHKTALENGGNTIFVLVDGILKYRAKKDIKDLLKKDNHLIVSQFPPFLSWTGRNAMKRNSTIIGLSRSMVLVESGKSGGTFAAGKASLKHNHPLFVVDFEKPGSTAEANPFFINSGGIPIRGNRFGEPNLKKLIDTANKHTFPSQKDKVLNQFRETPDTPKKQIELEI